MSYVYREERLKLFTEDGVATYIAMRDHAFALTKAAGAARAQEIMSAASGDSWTMLAALDYMVERGELIEVDYGQCPGQHRIFTRPYRPL